MSTRPEFWQRAWCVGRTHDACGRVMKHALPWVSARQPEVAEPCGKCKSNQLPSACAAGETISRAREMVADWQGAGRAITGKYGAMEWYQKNKSKMKLHPFTKIAVEVFLDEWDEKGGGK